MRRLLTIGFLLVVASLGLPSAAHAYLDPGTGSYIFQLILAGIVGFLFLIRVYWKKLKALVTNLFSKKPGANDEQDA